MPCGVEIPNDRRHRAATMTPTIFHDQIADPAHAVVLACLSLPAESED